SPCQSQRQALDHAVGSWRGRPQRGQVAGACRCPSRPILSWPTPVPICDGRCSPGAVLPGSPPDHADADPPRGGEPASLRTTTAPLRCLRCLLAEHAPVSAPELVVLNETDRVARTVREASRVLDEDLRPRRVGRVAVLRTPPTSVSVVAAASTLLLKDMDVPFLEPQPYPAHGCCCRLSRLGTTRDTC